MTDTHSDFVHLHVHTQFSLLDGACRHDELLDLAKEYNMPACAITDHGNMFGAIEFYKKAQKRGIKPIIGCEVYVAPESRFDKTSHGIQGAYHLVLLVKNMTGYKNLMELVSIGYLEGFYYRPRVDKEVLARHNKGLIALSACLGGEVPHFLLSDQWEQAKKSASEYAEIFGEDNFYLEVQDNQLEEQNKLNKQIIKLAEEMNLPLVATNDVHYLDKTDSKAHDALLCIQTQTTIAEENRMMFNTDQLYFKSPEEMKEAFSGIPEAVKNTGKIASKCNLELDFNERHLPKFTAPDDQDNDEFFEKLVREGIQNRYGNDITSQIKERVDHEMQIIKDLGYVSYFLIVWDFINHAKEKGIPVGPGRGSAAGSIVSYALGITDLDPIKYGLIFERFLNPDRITMPDIDIDFCFERRNEVIDYVIEKYSKENVAQIITFGTMMAKGVLRDVGRVMGMLYADVDKIAKLVPNDIGITLERALEIEPELMSRYEEDPMVKQLIDTSMRLEGLSRHAGKHAAGVVISDKPLQKRIPLFKTSDDQITTGYSMKSLDEIGLLKMDFLGLKTLTVIDQTIKIVKRTREIDVDIDRIPLDDKATFELLSKAETAGVFQLESGGMRDLLRKLRPERFEDLIAILALYRPGPMGSGMLDDFIKRKQGHIEVKYDHPSLEPILKETYGIIVFQEQVMNIVSTLAGFTMAEADNVRKVMGKKIPEALSAIKDKFLDGSKKNKVDPITAEKIWDYITYFAGYGFNKSHSAAYAMISYRTAYLKANFPVEFMTALLTSEKNNSDKISDYISEAQRMKTEILPPDVNESFKDFTVVGSDIRFGLSAVKNVGSGAAESIISKRQEEGKFESLYDFALKIDMKAVNRKVLESLIKCGAFDSIGIHRSQAMAVLDKVLDMASNANKDRNLGQMSFFDDSNADESFKENFHDVPDIPEWSEYELLANEKEMIGFYITNHPLARFEKLLNAYSTCKISELAGMSDGQEVLIGGIINKVRTTVTRKKAEKMAIIRLEDLENFVEVLVFPKAYRIAPDLIKEDNLVYIHGRLNLREEEPKLVAEDIIPLEKVKERFTKSVLLKLSTTGLEEQMMKRIRGIIKKFKGKVPIYIDIIAPTGRKIRLATDKTLLVNPTGDLISELEELVGSGNIKFLTK